MQKWVLLFLLVFIPSVFALPIVDPSVSRALEENSSVEVIVILKPAAEVVDVLPQSVQSEENVQVEHSYNATNGFSGNITEEGLTELLNQGVVARVELVQEYHIDLSEALPLVNTSRANGITINGINMTGNGQTVCIIDTGINYTHESLGNCSQSSFLAGTCAKVVNGTDYVNNDANPYDDNGHGTHVAGIAAGNGSIKGIAPNARIVAVKACNSAGSCSSANVLAGIDYCTSHASEFNISVISMSLGDSQSHPGTSSCPTSYDSAISAAVALNITVVVASGNQNFINGISHPACAPNVTSVGATYDANVGSIVWSTCTDSTSFADKLSCFTNRAAGLDILAPGAIINSTSFTGLTTTNSGTSMATPVVAGIVLLMQQYNLNENGVVLNASYANFVLNRTGAPIFDANTSLTFSRADVHTALIYLDAKIPFVMNMSRSVTNINGDQNVTFSVNVSDSHLSSVFFQTDVTGTLVNYSMLRASNSQYEYNLSSLNFTSGSTVKYRVVALDANNNMNASSELSFVVGSNVAIVLPSNNSFINQSLVNFTVVVNEQSNAAVNCTFYLDGVLNATNLTVLDGNMTTFAKNISESAHNWSVNCRDALNTNISSGLSVVTVDVTYPTITLSSPANSSTSTSTSNTFTFTPIDSYLANCTLLVGGSVASSSTSLVSNSSTSLSASISNGVSTTWQIVCRDTANNAVSSDVRAIQVSVPAGGGGEGGGGGGGGGSSSGSSDSASSVSSTAPAQVVPAPTIIPAGDTGSVSAKVKEKRLVIVDDHTHSITFKEITADSVVIILQSKPVEVTLKIGDSKEVDLTEDNVPDVLVTLRSIKNGVADVSVKALVKEVVDVPQKEINVTEYTIQEEVPAQIGRPIWPSVVGVCLVVIVLISIVVYMKMHKANKR